MDSIRTTTDLLTKLVSFDTTSRNSNLKLISFVEEYLSHYGIDSRRVYDKTGQKANLLASIGPLDRAGYVLSGHTDVVPVDGQAWSSDPFSAEIRDARMYGRGTVDMKGFLAVILAAVPGMVRAPLKKPLHLAFSYDEEIGMLGVPGLIDEIGQLAVPPVACFVGEPTEMQTIIAHKGKQAMCVEVTGLAGHSSLTPQAVNAVEYAARLVTRVHEIARRLAKEGTRDELYDVPYSTGQSAIIQGGTHLSTIPDICRFEFEFRSIGADNAAGLVDEVRAFAADTLEPEMHSVAPQTGISFTVKFAYPGLETAADAPVTTLAQACGGGEIGKVAFGAEAGLFSVRGGIATVVCGPGSIAQAHKPDEYIELSELEKGCAFMQRLLEHASAHS